MTGSWKLSSPTAILTWVLVGFLLLLAAFALLAPAAAASGYGVPLASTADAPWLYVKAGRDLGLAVALAMFLLRGQRSAVGWFLLATCVIPITDALIVTRDGTHVAYALAVHGSAAVYEIVLGVAVLWGARRSRLAELRAGARA